MTTTHSKIGFHTAGGGNKNGLGEWERKLNAAGIPVFIKSSDEYGILAEALDLGAQYGVDNWLIYRVVLDKPHDVPNYYIEPSAAADEYWQRIVGIDRFPPEFDKTAVWLDVLNEPRAKYNHDKPNFENMHPVAWLGAFSVRIGEIALRDGYKVCLPSFNGGEPAPDPLADCRLPEFVNFLRLCGKHPDRIALSVHEYSWSQWENGSQPSDWYPHLWGRLEAAIAACDLESISRDITIFGTEFGWGHEGHAIPPVQQGMAFLRWYDKWAAQWPQLKGVALWSLQSEWAGIADAVQPYIAPLTTYQLANQFEMGDQPTMTYLGTLPNSTTPPEPIIPSPPAEAALIFSVDFTGWGESDGQQPSGWRDSLQCPNVQIPYMIEDDVRSPMAYKKYEGDNPYGDGESWNDFACPEAVIMWRDMLPADEHFYLNENGRCQHWFTPAKAARSRFYEAVELTAGRYELRIEFWGDFAQFEHGEKVPQADPQHGQIELFVGQQGRDEFIDIDLIGENVKTAVFTIAEDGEYEIGYGLLSRYAPAGGVAGFFLQGFTVTKLGMAETKPKIVIVKKPQKNQMTRAENQRVSEWAWEQYGRTATHSIDDMMTMLRGGNGESYAVVWWPERQEEAMATLNEDNLPYITMPKTAAFSFTHWPTPHRYINQAFGANPAYYAQFGLPGHEGTDIRAYHGDPIYAVADGIISQVHGTSAGSNYGIYLRIAHAEDYETTYAHLDHLASGMHVNEEVGAGQIIGYADSTGNSSGSHLHLTLKRKGHTYTDPAGNVWPYEIHDCDAFLRPFSNVTWPSAPPPTPPAGETVAIAPYFEPQNGDIGIYTVFHFDNGSTQPQQMIRQENGRVVMFKGEGQWIDDLLLQDYEEWWLSDAGVHKHVDTSDAGNGGRDAYNLHGEVWLPATVQVGETYVSKPLVSRFDRVGCAVHSNERTTDYLYIREIIPQWTSPKNASITFNDVLVVEWRKTADINTSPAEVYKFAKGVGYVAWGGEGRDGAAVGELPQGREPLGGALTGCA